MSDHDSGKLVDLEPHNWKSDREKPREPFFGPGLPDFLAYVIPFTLTAIAVHYFLR